MLEKAKEAKRRRLEATATGTSTGIFLLFLRALEFHTETLTCARVLEKDVRYWVREESPTLGCSIEILYCRYVVCTMSCCMSN